jgi:hypothetical protein
MTTPFDWDRLVQNTFDLMYDGDNAAAYIRTRIEAAFVPVDQHRAICMGYSLDVEEATARAEDAEAEVRRLRDTPNHIWAEARDTEWDAGFNHAVALFRQAIGGEQ